MHSIMRFFKLVFPLVLPIALAITSPQSTRTCSAAISADLIPARVQSDHPDRSLEWKVRLREVNPIWDHISVGSSTAKAEEVMTTEIDLLRQHFELVIERLKNAHTNGLSRSQLNQRSANIQRLVEYMDDGVFPKNVFVVGRRPVFIDPWGTHCAVGHLIASSGHAELAQRINREHRLDELKNIKTEGLSEWQQASGLRIEELALIQPHYHFRKSSQTIQYPPELESLILGDSSGVLQALENGKLNVQSRCGGKTLLHFAAAAGDLNLVKRLASLGADLDAISTLGCDQAELKQGGNHSRFEVRWDASTKVTQGDRYAARGRVYTTVRGSHVADVLQDFFGGIAGKNPLHFATAKPRLSNHGNSIHRYHRNGQQHPFGAPGTKTNPLDELKGGRADVAKWLRENGVK